MCLIQRIERNPNAMGGRRDKFCPDNKNTFNVCINETVFAVGTHRNRHWIVPVHDTAAEGVLKFPVVSESEASGAQNCRELQIPIP